MKPSPPTASRQIGDGLDRAIREAAGEGRRPAPATVDAETPKGRVSVSVEDADRLGVLAGPVNAKRADGGTGSVGAQARELARRVNYLQEPLAVVETEDRRGRAVVRSAAPRPAPDGGREYNEAVLTGGDSVTIRRYRAEPGARRKTVPSNLSREALGRLADDLVDILAGD